MKVLVTAIGTITSKIVVKELKKRGLYVYGADMYPKEWVASSKDVDCFVQVPEAKSESYIDFMLNYCKKEKIDLIIPIVDFEIWKLAKERSNFNNEGIKIGSSNFNTIKLCSNKLKNYNFLKKNNFNNLIPTWLFSDMKEKKAKKELPLFLKPVRGMASNNCYRINDLNDYYYYKKKIKRKDKYLIQKYIDGEFYVADVLGDGNGDSFGTIIRKELLRNKNGTGTVVKLIKDKKMKKISEKLTSILKLKGVFNIEFIKNGNNIYLLEVNPRFSAGSVYSILSGVNLVNFHYDIFMNNNNIQINDYKDDLIIARRYEEYITKG
jgi:carbamoyl-phosphate synthase large subunit